LVPLRPSGQDVLDAGFLLVLIFLGLWGFTTTFSSPAFLAVCALGSVLGIVLTHLANVLRWHWLIVVAMSVVVYMVGGMATLGPEPLTVANVAIHGWKDMLTVAAPLPDQHASIVLPYLMAVEVATCGFAVARRTRVAWPAMVLPTILVVAGIVLGTQEPTLPAVIGLGYALVGFSWLAIRAPRRLSTVKAQTRNVFRGAIGAGMLVIALAVGFVAGPHLPGMDPQSRIVARTYIQPPVQLPSLGSPLAAFRKFSSETLAEQDPDHYFYDQDLLSVEGAPKGTWVRFAVMDSYNGITWSATGGGAGPTSTGFQRIGSQITDPVIGERTQATITIGASYAEIPNLQMWVPSIGSLTSVDFLGAHARSHIASQLFNRSTSQVLAPDVLRAEDVVDESAVVIDPLDLTGDAVQPGGSPLISSSGWSFLAGGISKVVPADQDAWGQLVAAAAYLHDKGYWSDGTGPGQEIYRPGQEQARLSIFLDGETYPVGSDEQYAAAFALIANSIGYPARVVMGAQVPEGGTIQGKDVTAWIEVLTNDGRWHPILPSAFIPDRDKAPQEMPPQEVPDKNALDVPPPNPVEAPIAFDPQFTAGEYAVVISHSDSWLMRILTIALRLLPWVGPPVGLIILVVVGLLGLKAGRRGRRSKRGVLSSRVAGGWEELMDLARDMGYTVPRGTRHEQTLAIGRGELADVAHHADVAIFGPAEITASMTGQFWREVRGARKTLLRSVGRMKRWAALLNPRSLVRRST